MSSFKNKSLLEIVEEYAEIHGLVENSEHLSELFDDEVAPTIINTYGENDHPALSEAFSLYKDYLQSEGRLHYLQVEEYCYEGKWEKDETV